MTSANYCGINSVECHTPHYPEPGALRVLDSSAAPVLQELMQQCTDYYLFADGEPPSASAAADEFSYLPAAVRPDCKFIYAAENPQGHFDAMIEGLRHYPSAGVWYIGLMLVHPALRSTGVGTQLFRQFEILALTQGAQELRLCVFDENPRSLKFWTRLGFVFRRAIAQQAFGVKFHSRTELSKTLHGV
jgi:GNAT superfamily N-acetyltransferase